MTNSSETTHTERLANERNIWIACVRPDERPHLTPVWFAWEDGQIYICIQASSVKARNFKQNPGVVAALEDGTHPVICEGTASPVQADWPANVVRIFQEKYDWNILEDKEYDLLVAIRPEKWLKW
jgi:nitroimidazol reductase NimA-like FMN-containing flavoprotein (pyridoxamine 5'-phosphate oxidase superfamily)